MHVYRVVLLSLWVMLAGCTNVAGDRIRVVTAPEGGTLPAEALMRTAVDFFTEAGYACSPEADSRLRCRKDIRDLYIHQTHAVVEVFPEGNSDGSDRYLLIATRWDEGMIPGEFISSEFANADVADFCAALQVSEQGVCRIED